MTPNRVQLGAVANVLNGYAFKSKEYVGSGIRIVRITNVQKGRIEDDNPKFIDIQRSDEFQRFMLEHGDILISLTGNVGRVGVIEESMLPAALNQRVGALKIKSDQVVSDYLFHVLNSNDFEQDAIKNSKGIAQLNLSSKWIEKYKIPLPPLPEQKRIAAILDAADALRAKRRESLEQLDSLLQSTFLEMFGDPVTNPKGWTRIPFGDLIVAGPQNGIYKPSKLYGSGAKILRIDGFYDGAVSDLGSLKRVQISEKEIETYGLSESDIVINRVNSRSHLGKCALIPALDEPVVFESNMMRLRLNTERMLPRFATEFLQTQYVKNQILNACKDAVNQSSINQGDVKGFRMLAPPIDLQNRFATFVESIESQKARYRAHLAELDTLFASLQSRAFNGEL